MFWETFLRLCAEADTSPKEAMPPERAADDSTK